MSDVNVFNRNEADKEISLLSREWINAKSLEDKYRQVKVDLENKLLSLASIDPDKPGARLLDHGVKVSCKLNRKWDQEFLKLNMDILSQLGEACPFRMELKEDKKMMDALEVYHKDAHQKLSKGLEVKAAKPTFSCNETKRAEKLFKKGE